MSVSMAADDVTVSVAVTPALVFLVLCLMTSSHGQVFAQQLSPRVIATQYGKLRGLLITLPPPQSQSRRGSGLGSLPQRVEAYLGLQYASVLDGELRFMPPTSPMDKWESVRVALKHQPVCPQRLPDLRQLERHLPLARVDHFRRILPFLQHQSEECLNLNIYVPYRDINNVTDSLPVVVMIHAETYDVGTGNAYDPSTLVALGNVIAVTLNFRLGVFGFLSTADSSSPGNYGLLDQVAALHWIQENIAAFGGNPREVTLLGQGHAAAMVHLLLVSPVTKGKSLFKRAIIQSGSAFASWALVDNPMVYTRQLASAVNCSSTLTQGTSDILRCLKQKSWEELLSADIVAPKYFSAFGPVIDGRSFLPSAQTLADGSRSVTKERDFEALQLTRGRGSFGSIALLAGVMRSEGLVFLNQSQLENGLSDTSRRQTLRTYIQNVFRYQRQSIFGIVDNHYTDWEQSRDSGVSRDEVAELLGDGQYVAPVTQLLRQHASQPASTYAYVLGYPARYDRYPRWATASHGDDVPYLLGSPLADTRDPLVTSFTPTEKLISEIVMTYWTNFISSGDPNKPRPLPAMTDDVSGQQSDMEWPTYDNLHQQYMFMGTRPVMRHHYRGAKMALWLDLVPRLHIPNGLDLRYHLLDSFSNRTTFEAEGTLEIDMGELQRYNLHISSTTTMPTPPPHVSIALTTLTSVAMPTAGGSSKLLPEECTDLLTQQRLSSPRPSPAVARKEDSSGGGGAIVKENSVSLALTIAVGCALLFVNILVLAGICFQRGRMQQERKQREQEEAARDEEEDNDADIMQLAESESAFNLKGSLGGGLDTDGVGGAFGRTASHSPQYANVNHSHTLKQPIGTANNFYTAPRRPNGRAVVKQPDASAVVRGNNCVDNKQQRTISIDNHYNNHSTIANHNRNHHNPSTLV